LNTWLILRNRFWRKTIPKSTPDKLRIGRQRLSTVANSILGVILALYSKLDKLYQNIKRWQYACKPTKKARKNHRLENLLDRISALAGFY